MGVGTAIIKDCFGILSASIKILAFTLSGSTGRLRKAGAVESPSTVRPTMTADDTSGATHKERIGTETTVPVKPAVGDRNYNHGEMRVDIHQDGVELHLTFPAGPVHIWMTHEDSRQIQTLLGENSH